jgi:hypothetical protein
MAPATAAKFTTLRPTAATVGNNILGSGYTVYVVDQIGRARSGWNATPRNNAETKGDVNLSPKGR